MRLKIVPAAALLAVALLVWLAYPVPSMLRAADGFAAKWVCSNVFVGGRTAAEAIGDLPPNPLADWLRAEVVDDAVTARVFGGFARTAVFRDGFGCTLVPPGDQRSDLAPVPPVEARPRRPRLAAARLDAARTAAVEQALARAFEENEPDRPKNTRAALVMWDGGLVAERYADGFGADTPLPGWSMTKSVLNALYGRAVELGVTAMDHSPAVPSWTGARRAITFDQLMRMSSGLAFTENYADLASDAVRMLFIEGDSGGYAAARRLEHPPDGHWSYARGTSNLLSRELRRRLGDGYLTFPRRELFAPLGMASAVLEPDASGTFVASSFGWATARDWGRFGQLYLDDGVVDSRRLLPPGWVDYTRRPTPAAPGGRYGAHFWLNAGEPGARGDRRWPGLPEDLYLASGFDGQAVVIVPSRRAVIVRLGLSQGDSAWRLEDFVGDVLAALPAAAAGAVPDASALPATGVESGDD